MKNLLTIFLLLSLRLFSSSVEYVAGSVSYKHLLGACPYTKFEITVTLFTKHVKVPSNFLALNGIGGFAFIDSSVVGNNIVKSNYKITQTYPSCGSFIVTCADTINNQNVKNSSPNNACKFYISTTILLSQFSPPNHSYIQFFSPATKIFKNHPFSFNPISNIENSLDYDSIITSPYSFNASGYFDYYIPSGVIINKTSGEIRWLNPDTVGKYGLLIETKMYKYGRAITKTVSSHNFEVINLAPSYIYDSINKVSVSSNNFKEIFYEAGNAYTFSAVYTDLAADSVKMLTYPLDFFNTAPSVIVTKNSTKKHSLNFSWSPQVIDERLYPYNFVLQSVSYYPGDSVINSYQTVSFRSSVINSIPIYKNENRLNVYPNPTTSSLHILDEQNDLSNSSVEISNSIGQTILQKPFSSSIDVSILPEGCYFLTITTTQNQALHSKFVKQ